MRKGSLFFVIIAIITTFFFHIETTTEKKMKLESVGLGDYLSIGTSKNNFDTMAYVLKNADKVGYEKFHENNELSLFDGIKNGYMVVASFFRDFVVGGFLGYLSGFHDKGIFMKIIWFFWGIVYIPIKAFILSIFGGFKLAFNLLTQKAGLTYYLGYIISLFFFIVLSRGFKSETNCQGGK